MSFNATDSALYEFNQNFHHADYQYELLVDSISSFQSTIDNESEIVLMLTSFGKEVTMYVTDISYSNPSLIYFYGLVNGKESVIIQHVSQLNFLITSAPKLKKGEPARRIGFNVER